MFLHADSEDSDQTGRMSRLSLRWAQRSFCWFGRTAGGSYKGEPCSKKVLTLYHRSEHVVNRLLREKRKSIPKYLSGKFFFQKCNPQDFKFFYRKIL